ncbi:hypothetical protein AA313_de0210017 [Arthrobotrys entomopaga]|nr:hypothetical protein AA313_de0210017 [Arthrobotrys entomopaga]
MTNFKFGIPLWQFVGLIIAFSILIGSPIFICFMYHRRKERDRLTFEVRRTFTSRDPYRSPYLVTGRDHYMVPFPDEVAIPRSPSRPGVSGVASSRKVSGSSVVPLLNLTPGGSRGGSRNVTPATLMTMGQQSHGREMAGQGYDNEVPPGGDDFFAERAGNAASLAYPRAAHRGRLERVNYGTLGVGAIMQSTYTAAQRVYRGREKMNFWSAWMGPWLRKNGNNGNGGALLPIIDEESLGSGRAAAAKGKNNNNNINPGVNVGGMVAGGYDGGGGMHMGSSEESITKVITNDSGTTATSSSRDMATSVGTFETTTTTSGFTMRGTPPTFDKVDALAGYNPNMARSLTRRLLKVGFEAKDGIAATISGGKIESSRQASGPWKGRLELKKRAMERKKSGGGRLFSFQKKKSGEGGVEDGNESEDEDIEEGEGVRRPGIIQGMDKTSIRDFAHAFTQDIIGTAGTEDVPSTTGTIRVHQIEEEEEEEEDQPEQSPVPQNKDTDSANDSITGTTTTESAKLDSKIIDWNVPTMTVQAVPPVGPLTTPPRTLRGRRTTRSLEDVPNSQKKRMARNTPKSTVGRIALSREFEFEKDRDTTESSSSKEQHEVEEFEDITKEVFESEA